MSDQFLAEIRIFPFNFAPFQWAMCAGQIMPISQNTALFSLLGTSYGGNGTSTFALPNFQGNVPVNQGQAPGLSDYVIGQEGGSPNVTLTQGEMAMHAHSFMASTDSNNLTATASGNQLCQGIGGDKTNQTMANIYSPTPANATTQLGPATIGLGGGGLPHNNMMPILSLNFCIALAGLFPARN